MDATATTTTYPGAEYRPVPNQPAQVMAPTRGLVPYTQHGTGSLYERFNEPAAEVSAHLWLSRDGRLEQYLPFDREVATGGSEGWVSCVCEGLDTEDYTEAQIQRLSELYSWGMREFGWPAVAAVRADDHGVGLAPTDALAGHDRAGSGTMRAARRHDVLAAAAAVFGPGASDPRERYHDRPVLAEGAVGDDVRELQWALNVIFHHEFAFDPHRIGVDGSYGPQTTARVGSLQGYITPWYAVITVDGVCGPDTWRKIGWILTKMGR